MLITTVDYNVLWNLEVDFLVNECNARHDLACAAVLEMLIDNFRIID